MYRPFFYAPGAQSASSPSPDVLRLLRRLLEISPGDLRKRVDLAQILVVPMADGGMGSHSLYENGEITTDRRFGSSIAEIEFLDIDSVPVSAALFLDERGKLFELDVFKADFSPLRSIPISFES